MAVAAFAAAILASPAPVTLLRHAVFDAYQRLMPRERASEPVTVVEIDEKSLAALGQWPWPRTRIAELIDRIEAMQPAAIGIDLLFSEPDRYSPALLAESLPILPTELARSLASYPSTDTLLAESMAKSKVVLGVAGAPAVDSRFPYPPRVAPMRINTERPMEFTQYAGHLQSLPELDRAAKGRGILSNDTPDGVVRRAPMLARIGPAVVPALSLEMLRVAAGGNLELVDRAGGGLAIRLANLSIPVQRDGTVWIRYSRHAPQRFVSAVDVLGGKVNPERIGSKLVLIGITGLGLLDYRITALGERVPGVEIHAQLIEQLFEDSDLRRPGWAPWTEVLLLLVAGAAIAALAPRHGVARVWLATGAFLVALVAVGFVLFAKGSALFDYSWAGIGVMAALAIMQAGTLSKADRTQRRLSEMTARMEGELDAGKRIQMGLLPIPANLFGGDPRFSMAASLTPARTVGGDFYECFWLDSHRVFFAVADVSGKGLPAALFMAASKSHLKSAVLLANGDLARALASMENELAHENPEQLFITLFAAVLDAKNGTLHSINAGHDAPLLARNGEIAHLERASGPPLGVVEGLTYEVYHRPLQAGDRLLVFTDGVTEAMDRQRALFGSARLAREFARVAPQGCAEIVAELEQAVIAYSTGVDLADDVTLLCLEWHG